MNTYLGEIAIFAFNYAPLGWAPCIGQQLVALENQALYSLLGTKFGGDGVNFFNLPDYRDLAPKGSAYYIAIQGIFPPRQ